MKVSLANQDLPGLLMLCPDIYCRCIQISASNNLKLEVLG